MLLTNGKDTTVSMIETLVAMRSEINTLFISIAAYKQKHDGDGSDADNIYPINAETLYNFNYLVGEITGEVVP